MTYLGSQSPSVRGLRAPLLMGWCMMGMNIMVSVCEVRQSMNYGGMGRDSRYHSGTVS